MDRRTTSYTMNHPSPPALKGQFPYTPRRPSTASGRPTTSSGLIRPSTSPGEALEPTSTFLRDALRERKGISPRARSTTPKQVRLPPRSQSYRDEWIQSPADDNEAREKLPAPRPTRTRRMSDITASRRGTPPTTTAQPLGARETENRIDKLEKENWDLKHRITLHQERSKMMTARLEEHEADAERLKKAAEKLENLTEKLSATKEQLELEKENNVELTQINEELVQQLELRDKELETLEKDSGARQTAIEEAAGIIQHLEQQLAERDERVHLMQQHGSPSRHDSDYYSADADTQLQPGKPLPAHVKPPATSHSADSDYFSADTSSPLVTPKTVNRGPATMESNAQQLSHAQQSAAAFNREVGIRSITSKDSLFSSYLESPKLPQQSGISSRILRLKSLRKRNQPPKLQKVPEVTSHERSNSQPRPVSRPLRNLYMTGELGMRINSNSRPIPPVAPSEMSSVASPYSSSPETETRGGAKSRSTPSVVATQASPDLKTSPVPNSVPRMQHNRSNSTNSRPAASLDLPRQNTTPTRHNSRPTSTRTSSESRRHSIISTSSQPSPRNSLHVSKQRASTISPSQLTPGSANTNNKSTITPGSTSYNTPAAQSAPTYSSSKPTTKTHRAHHPPNFSMWPRRYPAWPPSAGLVNRDLLFHGDGMDEMFGNPEDEEKHGRHW